MARVRVPYFMNLQVMGFTLGIKSSPLCTRALDFIPRTTEYNVRKYYYLYILCTQFMHISENLLSKYQTGRRIPHYENSRFASSVRRTLHFTATSCALLHVWGMVSTKSICCQPIAARPALSTQAS